MKLLDTLPDFSLTSIPKALLNDVVFDLSKLSGCEVAIAERDFSVISCTDPRYKDLYTKPLKDHYKTGITSFESQYDGVFIPHGGRISLLPINCNSAEIGFIFLFGEPKNGDSMSTIQFIGTQLILSAYWQQDEAILREIRRSYIYNWLYNTSNEDWESFVLRGVALGIDVNLDRIVCLFNLKDLSNSDNALSGQGVNPQRGIENLILSCVNFKKENIVISIGANYYVLLLSEKNPQVAKQLTTAIIDVLLHAFSCRVFAGISSGVRRGSDIQYSFWEARTACKSAEKEAQNGKITLFSECELSLLFVNMNEKSKRSFLNAIFHNCTETDILQFAELLQSYMDNNGSILKIADSLHIHKNTVQYQLNRLARLTGYDARNIKDMISLAIALRFYQEGVGVSGIDVEPIDRHL